MTIVDVARAAGVSRQTVSNVVNRPERVAPQTRRLVEEHIERLGYRATRAAQQLRSDHAGAWGFELDSFGERRMGSVLDTFLVELTARANVASTHVMPFVADLSDQTRAYRELVVGRHVDGFVLSNTRHGDPRPGWLAEHSIPFAAFGRVWDDPGVTDFADVDGAAGVRTAVGHLLDAGYRTVGYLGWPKGSPVGDDRFSGWVDATGGDGPHEVAEQGLEAAATAAGALIDRIGPGNAIVCASDVLAVGVWRALTERSLVPGRDVGVVGFDDSDLATAVGLTSLAQPLDAVADHLLALLGGRATGSALLEPTLVVRSSTLPHTEPTASRGGQDSGARPGSGRTVGGTS